MGDISQPKFEIRDLKAYYSDREVIHGINLEINKNEILSLIGPANSGITTLLRTLNRLCDLNPESRQEGEVVLDGKNIFDHDIVVTQLRRRVGMVFDVPTPLPLSIFDNVAYGLKIIKMSKADTANQVEQALRMSALWEEVKDRLSTPGMSLSGGQQQRLCMARVLALEPEVVLLDRPCSGLDPISTARIEESLMEIKEKYTIVIAPHNVQQAARISDRVGFMLLGDLIEVDTKELIFSDPRDQRTSDYVTGRFG
ncbi:MAG: phosphate ABC transporter ATP-binding protein [Eubacteriaceae bacterium]|nr:phosphate ABC transporter ATP-binding protein [Eubacteriaceae bacterium]